MKKWLLYVTSFVFIGAGALSLTPHSFAMAEGEISITTENDLLDLIKAPTDASYKLENNVHITQSFVDAYKNYGVSKSFSGTFDGNGYTITNLHFTSNNGFYGLFPYAKNAKIKNLKIEGFTFEFDEDFAGDVYAGGLVGYGENVIFENCEIILTKNNAESDVDGIEITRNSNISLGGLAGKLNGNARDEKNLSNVTNCLVDGDLSLTQSGDYLVNLGGIVGSNENSFISHTIMKGDVSFSGNGTLLKTIGGIAGNVAGDGSKIRNACFDGKASTKVESGTTANTLTGNIIGSKEEIISDTNFNYCYFTDVANKGIGGSSYVLPTFINVSSISKDLLTNEEKFDPALSIWDFSEVWSSREGVLRIQNFLNYNIMISSRADVNGVLKQPELLDYNEANGARYGQDVVIKVSLDDKFIENNIAWYELDGVYLNGSALSKNLYTVEEDKTNNVFNGTYLVKINAKENTAGTYSFTTHMKTFYGYVETKAEDENNDYGGVKIKGAGSTSKDLTLEFSYMNKSINIEGKGSGKYAFSNWKLYYKDSLGEWEEKVLPTNFDAYAPSQLLTYGSGLFNKEFKLVGIFTKDTKKIAIDKFDDKQVKSIKIAGETFAGEAVEVASSATDITLEITTVNATIETDKFIKSFNDVYGQQTLAMRYAPIVNGEERVYTFYIDMTKITKDLTDSTLPFTITTVKDRTSGDSSLLWLYITIPVVVIAGVILTIFLIKKKGGTKRRKMARQSKPKKTNYRDYYI